ncbi:MAG: phosphoglycolate phosphatase [Sinobacterium sp.]|nr:phosphoglycolate phosphatase [Sinobacterium sp.]
MFDGSLPKAVLFDLDGTLVDSVPDLAAAIDLALLDAGFSAIGLNRVRNYVGNGAQVLVHRAVSSVSAGKGLSAAELQDREAKVYQRFLYHYGHIPADAKASCLYDNVHNLLAALKNSHVKIALVTNKPAQFTPDILRFFAIDHFFDALVCGDTLAQKKPSAEPLLYATQQLNVAVDDCVMVGDSKNDIEAAAACNMKSVSVAWGYNYSEDPAELGADLHINNFSELL